MLSWLAGIIDGEGTITICRCRSHKGIYGQIRPIVQVVNTNMLIMKQCQKLFQQLTGNKCHIKTFNSGNTFKANKQCYRIQITGYKSTSIICLALIPYLIAKRIQAELLIDLARIRTVRFRQTIGDEEEIISIAIRSLNKESESVTTTRRTPEMGEDIVWSDRQLSEVDRNILPSCN